MTLRQLNLPVADVLALIGDGVISTDSGGRILVFNRAAEEMFGYTAEEITGEAVEVLLPHAVRDAHAEHVRAFGAAVAPLSRTMGERRPVMGRRKNGEEFPLEATLSRHRLGGEMVLTVALRDITERRALEDEAARRGRALEASEQRLRLALQSGSVGTWDWHIVPDLIIWDEAQAQLYGLTEPAAVTRAAALQRVHPEDREEFDASLQRALRQRHWAHEFRIRLPDGDVRWLAGTGLVIRDADGEPDHMIGLTFDVSARRRTEEERQLLMSEMGHRLQNLLTVVNAVVRLSGQAETSVEAYRRSLLSRLGAIAQTQRLLTGGVGAEATVKDLLCSELHPYTNSDASNVVLDGPAVVLPPAASLSLGLALHELTTNAAKHGALSVPTGRVEVSWGIVGDHPVRRLSILWREVDGPRVRAPTRQGFGSKLLERALSPGSGSGLRLDYLPEGLRCSIEVRLPGGCKEAALAEASA